MRTPASNPTPAARPLARSPGLALVIAVLVFALVVVAGIAYVTRDGVPTARHAPVTAVAPVEPAPPTPAALPIAAPAMPAPQRAAGAPAGPSEAAQLAALAALMSPPSAPPDLVKRVTEEAATQFEAYRPSIVKECWPSGGLPGGAKNAKITIHSTFDARGREIARGISEDRRARAGAFASCLRKLPGTSLSVSSPGRTVAVAIPMSYP